MNTVTVTLTVTAIGGTEQQQQIKWKVKSTATFDEVREQLRNLLALLPDDELPFPDADNDQDVA